MEPHKVAPKQEDQEPHQILVPNSTMYGHPSDDFRETVKQWTQQATPAKEGVKYTIKRGSYLDGDADTYIKTK